MFDIHLKTLGLSGAPDARTLRSAYLRLAQQFHPDRFAASAHTDAARSEAGLRMAAINEAYEWLKSRL